MPAVNQGERTVRKARAVEKAGAPELVKKMKAGEVTVSAAPPVRLMWDTAPPRMPFAAG